MAMFKYSTLFTLLSVVVTSQMLVKGNEVVVGMGMSPAPAPVIGGGGRGLVPAMFIFGDSLIDNGNNNNLFSLAKANYPPYGIDFNKGPTGRFSNGYTIVDEIGELLGLPFAPPYSDSPSIDQMRYGVNYASAAAGILDITGEHFVERVPFNEQITNFANTIDTLSGNLSADVVKGDIPNCIMFVGMGSNDYLNNYFLPGYPTSMMYNAQQFADLLIQQYTKQLTRLYSLGARKFVLAGVGQMGCIPTMLARTENGQCVEDVNQAVAPFNANMKQMIINFKSTLPDAKFVFLDTQNMFRNIIANSKTYGFSVIDRGCCGVGKMNGEVTCLPYELPCDDREQYIFWDAYHPTSAVNIILGKMSFNGGPDVAYPMNIQQLAKTEVWPF